MNIDQTIDAYEQSLAAATTARQAEQQRERDRLQANAEHLTRTLRSIVQPALQPIAQKLESRGYPASVSLTRRTLITYGTEIEAELMLTLSIKGKDQASLVYTGSPETTTFLIESRITGGAVSTSPPTPYHDVTPESVIALAHSLIEKAFTPANP